jgi:hypothetical protein
VNADRGKAEDREQLVVTEKKEEVEVEGETAMDLYITLGPLPTRLSGIQTATSLRRPAPITRTGNPCFLMQNHLHVNN